eukprot:scaffold61228_cov46-Attheya_sp.AAC.4
MCQGRVEGRRGRFRTLIKESGTRYLLMPPPAQRGLIREVITTTGSTIGWVPFAPTLKAYHTECNTTNLFRLSSFVVREIAIRKREAAPIFSP